VRNRIDLVLFDMDNVLCRYDKRIRAAYLANLAGSTPDSVYDAIWESGFELLSYSGALGAEDYLRGFGERIGYLLSLEEWLDARKAAMTPDIEVLEIVERLRHSVDIAILTNNITLVADHIDLLFPELRELFGAKIFASAGLNAAKPDVICYRLCLSELHVSPDTVLFVDDRPENVLGAEKAGLIAHHHTSPGMLKAVLRIHGIR
jgi:HAD superfamily hydrolase (TIGR01509 family)